MGWREITAVGGSARVAVSDVPANSVSHQLTSYPADLLTSPLDVRSAALSVVAGSGGGGAAAVAVGPSSILPRGVDQFTTAFVALVSRQNVDIPFVALALALALVLGGLHAFAPGHGKTLMAAYLVGQRGSLRHAATLAASVTVTHTIGVLALGVALSVSTSFAPAQIYPILAPRADRGEHRPHAVETCVAHTRAAPRSGTLITTTATETSPRPPRRTTTEAGLTRMSRSVSGRGCAACSPWDSPGAWCRAHRRWWC